MERKVRFGGRGSQCCTRKIRQLSAQESQWEGAAKSPSSQLFVREPCLNSDADGTVPNHIQRRQRGPNVVLTSLTRREGSFIVVPPIASANTTSGKVVREEVHGAHQDTKGWQHVLFHLCEHHAAAGSRDEHHQLLGCARDGENTFALFCASFEGEAEHGGMLYR